MAELAAAVAKNEETARIMAETARQLASMSESTQVILAKINEIGRRLKAVEEATAARVAEARAAGGAGGATTESEKNKIRKNVRRYFGVEEGEVIAAIPVPSGPRPPQLNFSTLTNDECYEILNTVLNPTQISKIKGEGGFKKYLIELFQSKAGGARTRRLKQRRNRKTKYRR